jgi:dTDP-glucose 4,6-dehydratase
MDDSNILITGGCGFIGSNFVKLMVEDKKNHITNLDALTYAGNPDNLKDIEHLSNYTFVKGDIRDKNTVMKTMKNCDVVVHFAAESHVDRSITGPEIFIETNVLGTNILLECAKKSNIKKFIFMSTDEVYGSVLKGFSKEEDPMDPSSPYSASKAAADLLVQAYHKTFQLPAIIVRGSNNFGPYQYPEKLIPLFVTNLLEGKKVPLYGTGKNIRDWIYVEDMCRAIKFITEYGENGAVYNVGGGNGKTNIEITEIILKKLGKDISYIEYVKDRLGHDFRYALDSTKIHDLGWKQQVDFDNAMEKTIEWYKHNTEWWKKLKK